MERNGGASARPRPARVGGTCAEHRRGPNGPRIKKETTHHMIRVV